MNEGLVIAVAKDYATVKIATDIFVIPIKGNLKKTHQLLVGDIVTISTKNGAKVITAIMQRKNVLFRPKIANVEQVLILNPLQEPRFNTIILNKLLTIYHFYQIKVILVFTKKDLVMKDDLVYKIVSHYQKLNYSTILVSNITGEGIKKITKVIANSFSLLTGITGAGKSSLLNNLNSALKVVTQPISVVLKHGKHTTTTTKIYFCDNGAVADSPGFTVLKLLGMKPQDIAAHFPLLNNYINRCKYNDCLHLKEPQCAVIAALNCELNYFFYQDYCKIMNEYLQFTKS